MKLYTLIVLLYTLSCKQIMLDESNWSEFLMTKNIDKRLEIYYIDSIEDDNVILDLIDILNKKLSDIDVYMIDCEKHNQAICDPYKIKYLPHVIFRYQGIEEDINGKINPLQIVEKILNFQTTPIIYLEVENDYKKIDSAINRDGICLLQVGKLNEKLIQFLSIEGIKNKKEFKIFSVQNKKILEKFGLEKARDGIYLLRDNPPSIVMYKREQSLEKFVHKYLFKPLPILTQKFFKKNQKKFKRKTVLIFNSKTCDKNEHKFFQKIYTFYDLDHFKFYEINKENDIEFYDRIRDLMGFDEECGMMIVQKINKFTWNKVVFPGKLDLDQVNEFFLELEQNKIPLYFKFQLENKSDQNELNGLNFEKLKQLVNIDFFVLFYTEESKKNSKMYKQFQDIIDKNLNENFFQLFKFNLDKNDVQSLILKEEPIIMYYQDGNSNNPQSFKDTLTLQQMQDIVNKHNQKMTDL